LKNNPVTEDEKSSTVEKIRRISYSFWIKAGHLEIDTIFWNWHNNGNISI